MLTDMGHPFAEGEPVYDVAFENVQAGLRTDYLFRLANQRRGFVIGTGDLSELALGWCTYGVGDQMSHYGVNAGVPKTLIQYLIRWCVASDQFDAATDAVLEAILGTEISPELVPAEAGQIQSTEAKIGPYELHDFFLYHTLRYGQRPSKVAFLAWHAWHDRSAGALADRLSRGGAARIRPRRRSPSGSRPSSGASSPSPSSSARRCRTGPRSRPAARCRRAATGARRRTRPRRRGSTSCGAACRPAPPDSDLDVAGAGQAAGRQRSGRARAVLLGWARSMQPCGRSACRPTNSRDPRRAASRESAPSLVSTL